MYKTLSIIAASVITFATSTVQANEFSIAYGMNTIDIAGFVEVDPTSLNFGYNYDLGNNFSLEAKAALGLSSDSLGPMELEVKSLLGGYTKYSFPIENTAVKIFGLAGLATIDLEASIYGESGTEGESGFSYGFGATVDVNESGTKVFAEYMVYPTMSDDGDDLDISAINLGVSFAF